MQADEPLLFPLPPTGGLVETIARAYSRPKQRPCKLFLSRASWGKILQEAAQVGLSYTTPKQSWWLFGRARRSPVFMDMEVCFTNDYQTGDFGFE